MYRLHKRFTIFPLFENVNNSIHRYLKNAVCIRSFDANYSNTTQYYSNTTGWDDCSPCPPPPPPTPMYQLLLVISSIISREITYFLKNIILSSSLVSKASNNQLDRSSEQRCSVRKGVLRNFAKFTECQSPFFNKVAGL